MARDPKESNTAAQEMETYTVNQEMLSFSERDHHFTPACS